MKQENLYTQHLAKKIQFLGNPQEPTKEERFKMADNTPNEEGTDKSNLPASEHKPEELILGTPGSGKTFYPAAPNNVSQPGAITPAGYTIPAERIDPTKMKLKKIKRKDYWGITPILFSFVLLLSFIVVTAIAFAVYGIINIASNGGVNGLLQNSDGGMISQQDATKSLESNPWIIIAGTLPMYIIWVAVEAWVTKYRSQVGTKFKTFWEAAKDNFRLRIKWYDVFIGLAVAGAFIGLQQLVFWLLPSNVGAAADNTQPFADLPGYWFFILGFGLVGILGPIMEELYFRGLIMRGISNHLADRGEDTRSRDVEEQLYDQSFSLGILYSRFRVWGAKHKDMISITVTAIIFGSFHFQSATLGGLVLILVTGSLGWVMGFLTTKLNRIAPGMFAHIFNNSIAVFFLLLAR